MPVSSQIGRLVLEDRLEHALAHLRLVRRVGGQELAALQDRVDDRRHVVVVDARRRGRTARGSASAFRSASAATCAKTSCSESAGSRSSSRPKRTACRQVAEELVDRVDADRREHLLPVGLGQRRGTGAASLLGEHLPVGAGVEQRVDLRRDPRARMRRASRSPYGSSFTVSGASTTCWFTSSTSPESGAITSETALTDSTSPYDWSFVTRRPRPRAARSGRARRASRRRTT